MLLPTRAQHAFRFIRHKAQGHFFVALIDPLLNILHRWQLAFQFFRQAVGNLVGTDADGLAHVLERILCHEVVLAFAEKQTNRGIVLLFLQDAVHR